MNFTELVTATYLRLGVPSGDALLTTTVVGSAVNEALHEIDSEQDWPWADASETISTVAGTEAYTPAATWLRTKVLRITDDQPMDRMDIEQLDFLWPFNASETGRPQAYAIEKEQIILRPVPDGVYVLRHRFKATEADISGSQTPLMPVQFHPAIACLAAHICLQRSRDDGRSAAALADYQRWISKMTKFKRRWKGPGRIATRWPDW